MYRRSLGMGLALLLIGSLCVQAAPQKPKPKPKPPAKNNMPSVDASQLHTGKFGGKLKNVPGSDRMFTVSITYQDVQLNPNYKPPRNNSPHHNTLHQNYQNVRRMQQQMARYRGQHHHHAMNAFMQMQQAMQQMQQQQMRLVQQQMRMMQQAARQQQQAIQQYIKAIQSMYRVVTVTRDFQFQAASDVKVRVMSLPDSFDEKGNIKTYTAEEKSKLKGPNKKLPGYEGTIENLQPGQLVQVWLMPHKAPPRESPNLKTPGLTKEKEKEDKAKDLDKEPVDTPTSSTGFGTTAVKNKRMQARMIVILQEANAPPAKSPQKPRRKK